MEQADVFNGQFTDVLYKSEQIQVTLLNCAAPFMEDILISAEGIIKLLKNYTLNKALGPDELLTCVPCKFIDYICLLCYYGTLG